MPRFADHAPLPDGAERVALQARFDAKVRRDPDGCWRWTAGSYRSGAGAFRFAGRTLPAPIMSYRLAGGTIPARYVVAHTCDHVECVNPDHLVAVSEGELARNLARQRRTHCPYGHPYNAANTKISPYGARQCRICNAEFQRRRRAAKLLG